MDDAATTPPPRMTTRGRRASTVLCALLWLLPGVFESISHTAETPAGQPRTNRPPPDGHWFYRPIQKVPRHRPRDARWPRNPVDDFVLSRLEQSRVTPSPDADKITLLRRVSLDLTGLPPTPEEADAFLADPSPEAYERLVDRFLANPHFGERWGRHWLDAARYADSDGYEKDRARPDAWRYRDWVIRALNENKPFDVFTTEQIAGDLLPEPTTEHIVATAFHRQTLTNDEGGVDKEQYRVEAVFDRVETVGTVWLGLTVGCARCHSHKYDALTQKEYYGLFSFLNNAEEISRTLPTDETLWRGYAARHPRVADYLEAKRQLENELMHFSPRLGEWERDLQARLKEARSRSGKTRFQPFPTAGLVVRNPGVAVNNDSSIQIRASRSQPERFLIRADSWEGAISSLRLDWSLDPADAGASEALSKGFSCDLHDVEARYGASWETGVPILLHSPTLTPPQKESPVLAALDRDSTTSLKIPLEVKGTSSLQLHCGRPLVQKPGHALWLSLNIGSSGAGSAGAQLRLSYCHETTEESLAPEYVRRSLAEDPARRPLEETKALVEWAAQSEEAILILKERTERLREGLTKAPLVETRVIAERTSAPRETRLLKRGDFLNPGEAIQPGTPSVLPSLTARSPKPDRLDFASWLVTGAAAQTARVRVNQIWIKLFGEGLVATAEDFGVRGDPPSHPELLEWLAGELVGNAWDQKGLIRMILTSATYRQSSLHRPEIELQDPRNRLLHRQNRIRVEAEIVRDIHLSAAGLLASRIGGPSVFPFLQADVAALSYAGNFSWTESSGANRFRRGLYTFYKRTAPHPDLTSFDCPDANFTVVRRHVSNTPLQALTTLNSEAFVESAIALGLASCAVDVSDAARLDWIFRRCVARPPKSGERAALKRLLDEARSHFSTHTSEADAWLATAPLRGASRPELAAWTTVARAVLNLDETITRE